MEHKVVVASALKASTALRLRSGSSRFRASQPLCCAHRVEFYSRYSSAGAMSSSSKYQPLSPSSLPLPVTASTTDDNFAKLNAAYYKAFVTSTTAEGEAIQLFTPYRAIMPGSDDDLLTHMDARPPFNLVTTTDGVPPEVPSNRTAEPTTGYYNTYKGMLADFTPATSASLWISLLKQDGQWTAWGEFRRQPKYKGKLIDSKMVKAFVLGPDYEGVLGEQIYYAYVQNSLQVPGSAFSNFDAFRDSDPPPLAKDYYQTTFAEVQAAIQASQGITVSFSFTQQTTDLSNTWAGGRLGGAVSLFSPSAPTPYDPLSQAVTQSSINFRITMSRLGTVVVDGKQGPWFQLSALTTARNKESGIFQNESQFYNHFNIHGTPKGDMVYAASELVVATGVQVQMQVKATQKQVDVDELKAGAAQGVWPFFTPSGVGCHTTDTKRMDPDTISITQGCTDPEQMFILGRKVYNIYDV